MTENEFGCSGCEGFNPVHRHDDGTWWFYDETWAFEYGPYISKEECDGMLNKYEVEVLGLD